MRRVTRAALALTTALTAACGDGGTGPGPTKEEQKPTYARVDVTIDVSAGRAPISPYIYGSSQDGGATGWTVRRYGGNRLTGYNWENNFSNAGSDWFHHSDLFLLSDAGLPSAEASVPARAVRHFHDQSVAMGAKSIVTLQMAGYVAADGEGTVTEAQTAPSPRWVRVEPRKGAPFTTAPNLTDGVVYMDELVSLLVQRYGPASSATGVRWYSLDNEPALWSSTHARIHPAKLGAQEIVDRSVALASAVKAVDPTAEIMGPVAYGVSEYVSLQDAPDWAGLKGGYGWFLDFYLDRMKAAEAAAGRRLLDALDVHYYPEARGDHRVTDREATTAADVAARLQAPRMLWDGTYRENSWVGQWMGAYLPLIPRLRQSIDRYYPGTRLAITEYDFGGGATVSGGIAQADVLGIFGREGVEIATMWGISAADVYRHAAFKLFRNYNGQGSAFGSTSVRAVTGDTARVSVYASIQGSDASGLHVILLNKDPRDTLSVRLGIAGAGGAYVGGSAWGFDATSPAVTRRAEVVIPPASGGAPIDYPLPPLTAVHLVLRRG